jgi:hypothetical protein
MMRFVGGGDGRVFAVGGGVRELGTFEWGKAPKPAKLVKAMLTETLDEVRATSLYVRFMHRTAGWWREGQPWTHTSDEVLSIVADIEQAAKEAGPLIAGANRERGLITPEPGLPGNIEYGGNDTAPDRKR